MSDTVKIVLIIAFFVFFIYKRKISAFLTERKTKRLSKKDAGKNTAAQTPVSSSDPPETAQNVSSSVFSEKNSSPFRYEVYAFDYAEFADAAHFADRLSAKLDVIEMTMQNKKHFIKYVELGMLLLILVKYQE